MILSESQGYSRALDTTPRAEQAGVFVRPGVAMADPRYRHAHQQQRKAWALIVNAGDAVCMQRDPWVPGSLPGTGCVMRTRWIAPGTPWQLAHDDTGTITDGPAHQRCNARDGAVRGNRARTRRPAAVAPTTGPSTGRWTL